MRTVSFQGTQLTDRERQKLAFHRNTRPLLNDHLKQMVDQSLVEDEQAKATGKKAPSLWTVERKERGTPYVGDIFKFGASR